MTMSREAELNEAIHQAVISADRIILDVSDGSCEETDWLTARLSEEFVKKVTIGANRIYMAKQMALKFAASQR